MSKHELIQSLFIRLINGETIKVSKRNLGYLLRLIRLNQLDLTAVKRQINII